MRQGTKRSVDRTGEGDELSVSAGSRAAARSADEMRVALGGWIGSDGCHAAFSLAKGEAQAAHDSLAMLSLNVLADPYIEGIDASVERFGDTATADAIGSIVVGVVELLGRLIGPDMTRSLVERSLPSEQQHDLPRRISEQMLLGALRERGLAESAEGSRRRATFLAEAGRLLTQSVDREGTLVALTRLALPTLGAWCFVDLLDSDETVQRLGIFHPDPSKQTVAARLEATWSADPADGFGAPAMLRNPQTIAVTSDIESVLTAGAHGADNLEVLRELGAEALLSVPLVARGRLLGAITFVSATRKQLYAEEELQLAEDLAHHGSLALDNAQLFDTARGLQHTAEAANRAKTAFLGAMGHELRTPLNAIGGYIDLIDMGLRGPVTDEQRVDLARVKTNQQHLLRLITEILDFARMGGGHVSYVLSDFSLRDEVERAVHLVEPLIGRSGLTCDFADSDVGIAAHADPEKVVQILVNLLSNSIKFTPDGGRISISTETVDSLVLVRICDTGVGIPADKIDLVFEPFVQIKDTLAGREAGIGLGLAISRDFARAMNGSLSVVSTEGQGSCFTLALPGSIS